MRSFHLYLIVKLITLTMLHQNVLYLVTKQETNVQLKLARFILRSAINVSYLHFKLSSFCNILGICTIGFKV